MSGPLRIMGLGLSHRLYSPGLLPLRPLMVLPQARTAAFLIVLHICVSKTQGGLDVPADRTPERHQRSRHYVAQGPPMRPHTSRDGAQSTSSLGSTVCVGCPEPCHLSMLWEERVLSVGKMSSRRR